MVSCSKQKRSCNRLLSLGCATKSVSCHHILQPSNIPWKATYPLVNIQKPDGKSPFWMGLSTRLAIFYIVCSIFTRGYVWDLYLVMVSHGFCGTSQRVVDWFFTTCAGPWVSWWSLAHAPSALQRDLAAASQVFSPTNGEPSGALLQFPWRIRMYAIFVGTFTINIRQSC